MMKKIIIYVIILSNIVTIYGNPNNRLHSKYSEGPKDGYSWKEREIKYDVNNEKLSIEILCSTKWVFESDPTGYNHLFIFYIDNVFKIGWVPSGVDVEGQYEIINNTIRLYDIKSKNTKWNNKEFLLTFNNDLKSSFQHGLISKDLSIFPLGSEPKEDEIYNYNGIELIKMNGEYYNNENVFIYDSPSKNTEPIETMKYAFSYGVDVSIKMFIQGDIIEVLGRTKVKENGNYWYLGKLEVYNSSKLVWFSTSNLIEYNDSKKQICNDLLKEGFILAGWDGVTDDPKYMP